MSTVAPPPSRRRGVMLALLILGVIALLMLMGLRHGRQQSAQAAIPTLTQTQEIALGQQAAPALAALHGGLGDADHQKMVSRVGQHIVSVSDAARLGWRFEFHLLAEPNILDAYSLPGGQIFITTALLNRLQTEGELAAVLAQQVAHVTARDVAHTLKAQGLTAAILGSGDISQLVPEVVKFTFTPEQELKADTEALKLMSQAGYSPNAMLGVMKILSTAYYAHADVAYFTTHPNAKNRIENITGGITSLYPTGVPGNLSE